MVRNGKFIIGKSKSSRLLSLEQRILGYNRQLNKLNTKVEMISAWITKKFGISFLVEASARVELKDLSKHLTKLKSTAQHSSNAGVKKAKEKLQSVASGRQHSNLESSAESEVMLVSDSDVDKDDNEQTSVREQVDGRISLEDVEPERRRRIPRQRKRKIPRNKTARPQVGANNGEGKRTKEERPRRTLTKRNLQAPKKGRQEHSCSWPNCNQCFSCKSAFVIHQRTHTGVKPFKCTWQNCGKSFTRNADRTKHRRRHTGEKPYVCDWPDCDKSFGQSGNLKVHRRTHTGDRPFKCGFCDYRCTHSSDLTSHIRIHTREKPFKCHVCPATFTRSSSKIKHEKAHH